MNYIKKHKMMDSEIQTIVDLANTGTPAEISMKILSEKYKTIDWSNVELETLSGVEFDEHCDGKHILGYLRSTTKKLHLIKCEHCASNPQLHGMGIYVSNLTEYLKKGKIPCGCSKNIKWTEYQTIVNMLNYKRKDDAVFCGLVMYPLLSKNDCIKLHCPTHGTWNTSTVTVSSHDERGCPKCKFDKLTDMHTVDDNEHIDAFMKTGQFKVGTIFCRTDDINNQNRKNSWVYKCPVCSNDEYVQNNLCSGVFKSILGSLKNGKLACRCAEGGFVITLINIACSVLSA